MPKTPQQPGRYEPRAGDLVDFPVIKNGQTQWLPTTFQQAGKNLVVRVGGGAYYIDKNFMQMHNIAYNGTEPDGKRKYTVFLRPVSQWPQRRYEVELIMSTQNVKSVHLARSEEQALTYAVIKWCKENQIPEHKYRVIKACFLHRDPGYDFIVSPLK